ncbi:DNA alkylation repair protein [Pseudalkalibacillus hwajinpoensis]|uniref:DNA alkylation repair protein n=1 Tax=Guptibacillus hwajinpoensis TaxID=208199 RepID=A0A4U1MN60_9BACL|nr:DNA alkylation repair protein [Pseudalkalibacillus hwajinpoensis]TKD72032.1 DNA alkylation repair protein [Pseudalkalibacillus hwajinpoensis]
MINTTTIQTELLSFKNPIQAKKMEKYMRNQFPFLGIKTPERRKAVKQAIRKHGFPDHHNLQVLLYNLWSLDEREYHNAALDLLGYVKEFPEGYIEIIEDLITTKSWWDTVDSLAVQSAGTYFRQYPNKIKAITEKWITSPNLWLNRSAIIFQISYKSDTDFELLKRYIRLHSQSKEFFHQKAIGWALREYSKTEPAAVEKFIKQEELAPLSKREGLKRINKH